MPRKQSPATPRDAVFQAIRWIGKRVYAHGLTHEALGLAHEEYGLAMANLERAYKRHASLDVCKEVGHTAMEVVKALTARKERE